MALFAFLAACFPVANSDFFQHLACGRLLAQGRFPFGEDPLAFTTAGVYWANSSWLFDLALYGLYLLPGVGGQAVVLAKALLVTALAGVMLLAGRRAGQDLWVPAACTALAVLALSPRLLLQPVCVSYLFLALTLWLLRRSATRPRSAWLLPPLFALWANLDEWVLLGPAAVALFLAGEAIQSRWARLWPGAEGPAPTRVRGLVLLLGASLAACLASPYHVHALALPWQLGLRGPAGALARDPELRSLFLSPLEGAYFRRAVGGNVGGLACFPLAGVGLVSFALNRQRVRWWRVLVWSGFFLLSLVNHRAVAFFAVVAGPVSALNFLDFAAARAGAAGAGRPRAGWPLAGRVLSVLAGLALVAATVPGWLQARPDQRRVGWGVNPDPSLRQVALQVRAWREEGLLGPEDRLFNTTPEVACYLAWFCPGERAFLDWRLSLFGEVAAECVGVRSALLAEGAAAGAGGTGSAEPAWRAAFRRWKVRLLVLHLRDPRYATARAAYGRLVLNPDGAPGEWTVCYQDGRTVVAGWSDPGRGRDDTFARLGPDPDRLAFGPEATPVPALPPAPTPAPPWWSRLSGRGRARPLAADEAQLHFFRYQLLRPRWSLRNRRAWEAALAVSAAAAGASPGGPLVNGGLLLARVDFCYRPLHGLPARPPGLPPQGMDRLAGRLLDNYLSGQDAGPPSALYLATRAARRALAEGAEDAGTCFLLGQVYSELTWGTGEQVGERALPHLALVRQAQATAALRQALARDPNHEQAHALLAALARRAVYLPAPGRGQPPSLMPCRNVELELRHRREQLRCARKNGPGYGETPADFSGRLRALDEEVRSLEGRVQKLLDGYEVAAFNHPARVKAELALERGLVETALNALLEVGGVGEWFRGGRGQAPGAVRAVELLLSVGRPEDAGELLVPENRRAFGVLPPPLDLPGYEWFRVQLAAARGDYAEADEHLAKAVAPRGGASAASVLLAGAVGHHLLWEAPAAAGMPWQVQRRLPTLFGLPPGRLGLLGGATRRALALWQRETDLTAVRGWLALEAGANRAARAHFRRVRALCRLPNSFGESEVGAPTPTSGRRAAPGGVLVLRALPFALRYDALLEANGPWPPPRGASGS